MGHYLKKFVSSRWELAFVQETLDDIVEGKKLHFIHVKNPYRDKYWFADPFVLDVTDEFIYLLVEAMPANDTKGIIAKLTISRDSMTITKVAPLLQESWHLSFPNIYRIDGKVFVYPESAHSGHLYLYELLCDTDGKEYLSKISTLCDDVIWDTDINSLLGDKYLFTSHQNNYFLDIYKWSDQLKRFRHHTSICSIRQNMRLAGALFSTKDKIYVPTQVSGYAYGQAIEVQEIHKGNSWSLKTIRHIKPPLGVLIDGMHTLNSYKGITVIDLHVQCNFLSLLISKLVILKKIVKNIGVK